MKYFLVYLLLLGVFSGVFLIGKKNKKHDYVDILWGSGFALSALEWLRFLLTPASIYDASPLEAEGM